MDVWNIIKNRRSIDPELYTGEAIEKIKIEALLEAANWAPTHGFTEPWRFIVYDKNSVSYKSETTAEQYLDKKFNKIKFRGKNCSHIIVCINKRGDKNNIPEIEELAATSCAIQNILLCATENNIATFWSTGGMCYHPKFKEQFGFSEQDKVLGIIYIGTYLGESLIGKRQSSGIEKTIWK